MKRTQRSSHQLLLRPADMAKKTNWQQVPCGRCASSGRGREWSGPELQRKTKIVFMGQNPPGQMCKKCVHKLVVLLKGFTRQCCMPWMNVNCSHKKGVWTFDFQAINTLETFPGWYFWNLGCVLLEGKFHMERYSLAPITSSPFSPPIRKRSSPVTEGHATDKRGMICKFEQSFKYVDWEKFTNGDKWQVMRIFLSEKKSYWGKKRTLCGWQVCIREWTIIQKAWEPLSSPQLKIQQLEVQCQPERNGCA